MYKFSAPMPYTKEDIDKLLDINKQIEKSKITTLYSCLPSNNELFTGFEQSRNFSFDYNTWDYWKQLMEYTLSCNCDFVYLLNSPRPLDIENPDFPKQLEKLDKLLTELRKIGVNKLRIASAQLSTYIGKHYEDFDVLASTSIEYKTIWEYQNFIHFHPEVKQIVPSHDVNKNFKLLSSLRKGYPNMELELMVNEGCLQGCPNRMLHLFVNPDKDITINNDICLSYAYSRAFCRPIVKQYPFASLIIGNLIFPWDIEAYEKIGIQNFKLVGRDGYQNGNFPKYIRGYTMYLKGVDDIKNIGDYGLNEFTHHLDIVILNELKVKDYYKYLPKIAYFQKHGHLCSSLCGIECRYCYKCAEKIQKIFTSKHIKLKK